MHVFCTSTAYTCSYIHPFPGTMTHNILTTTPIVSFDSTRKGGGVGLDVHFMLNTITNDLTLT